MQRVSTLMLFTAGERALSARQAELLQAQAQVSSGKRIATPSDDPVGSATVSTLRTGLAQLDQYASNQSQARFLLNASDNTVTQFTNSLQDAREKLLSAGNGGYGDSERQMLATDLQSILTQMVGLANTSDGVGGFLFAGTREGAAPFGQSGNVISYGGNASAQRVEVANNRFLQTKFAGDDMFLKIRQGNGTFTTAAAASNSGAGVIDAGGVIDPSQVTGSGYTIDFNGTQYVVTRASDNTQFTFAPGSGSTTLQFDGLRVTVTGTPATGDRFSVQPATYQSIFDTMAQAIAALKSPGTGPAAMAQINTQLGGAIASMDQALDHLLSKRAEIGGSLSELDGYQQMSESRNIEYQGRLSDIENVDYASAITELTRRQSTFEAAIKSYSSVSKLSLFDYL
jgi:flagellar hook-associated protein 3 FlgL